MPSDRDAKKPLPDPTPSGISDVDITSGERRVSPFDQVSSLADFDDDDEPSVVSPNNSEKQLLFKIGTLVQKQGVHVARIPGIEKTVTEVATIQGEMGKRQTRMDGRLGVIEKNGHPCKQQPLIDKHEQESKEWRKDKEEGIKTRAMVQAVADSASRATRAAEEVGKKVEASTGAVTKQVEAVRGSGRKVIGGLAVASVSIVLVIIGAAWNTGGTVEGLSQRIEGEKTVRTVQHQVLKARLDRLPTKSDMPSKQQMTAIKNSMVKEDAFEERCAKLTPIEKRHLARQVQQGHLPASLLCL